MAAAVATKSNRKPARAAKAPAVHAAPPTDVPERAMPNYDDVEGEEIDVLPSDLVFSEFNVRGEDDDSPVDDLAASMVALGVVQNLIVVDDLDAQGKPTGKRGVVAGGRRRRGIHLALADGRWPPTRTVRCKRVSREVAKLLSLAENSHRVPMHPADEFVAFRDLKSHGHTVEAIAAAFGVEPAVVRRRLRLANVAPDLLALFRRDEIEIDHMMAFALTDDHAAQLRVWNALPKNGRHAQTIRHAITVNELPCDHARVKFVGITAYRKAGGPVREDLFGSEDACYVQDLELLDRLALQKLGSRVKAVEAEGWGWVDVLPVFTHADQNAYTRLPSGHLGDPTDQQQKELSAIARELVPLQEAMDGLAGVESLDDEDAARWEGLSEQAEALIARREALIDDFHGLSLEALRSAGAVVHIAHNGRSSVVRGLVRPEDRKRAKEAVRSAETGESSAGTGSDNDDGAPRTVHSERLVRKLTANRTAALQLVLAGNHHVALATLAHKLLIDVGIGSRLVRSAVQISSRTSEHDLKQAEDGIATNPAHVALQESVDAWTQRLRSEDDEADGENEPLLHKLLALTEAELVEVLSLSTALCVNAVTDHEGRAHPADHLARAVQLDMANHWEATGDSYLSHVSKAQVLSVITTAVSADEAAKLDKLKKPDLVAAAETHLAGRRWLPGPLVTHDAT